MLWNMLWDMSYMRPDTGNKRHLLIKHKYVFRTNYCN